MIPLLTLRVPAWLCCCCVCMQVSISTDPYAVFQDAEWALMIGAKPRGPGQERADLLDQNGRIFVEQVRHGQGLAAAGPGVLWKVWAAWFFFGQNFFPVFTQCRHMGLGCSCPHADVSYQQRGPWTAHETHLDAKQLCTDCTSRGRSSAGAGSHQLAKERQCAGSADLSPTQLLIMYSGGMCWQPCSVRGPVWRRC
jgi:hypothetical protein